MAAVMTPASTGLEEKVAAALAACEKLEPGVVVRVSGDIVTLGGTVDCYARKLAATEAVRAVLGVGAVINHIEIPVDGFYGWRDIDVENAARHALANHYLLAKRTIDVMVDDRIIRLTGKVVSATERDEAERAVSTIPNVRGIRNEIVVLHPDARRWV
jgi:osmotically-inducible protein OsmY